MITIGSLKLNVNDLKNEIHAKSIELGIASDKLKDAIDFLIQDIINEYLIIEYARQNNIQITEDEINNEINRIAGDYSKKMLKEELLSRLMEMNTWKGLIKKRLLIEKVLKRISERIPPPSHKELEKYYYANIERFRLPEMVRFRQVLARTKKEAESIRQDFISHGWGKNPEYTVITTVNLDDKTGWVEKGMLDESMERVLFKLSVGEISPVVKTPYGYHIFQVLEKKSPGYESFNQVLPIIENEINRKRFEQYYRNWLKELRRKIPVTINEDLLKKVEFE